MGCSNVATRLVETAPRSVTDPTPWNIPRALVMFDGAARIGVTLCGMNV